MIKRLRIKIILISMILLGLVLLAILAAFCLITYKGQLNDVRNDLSQTIAHYQGLEYRSDSLLQQYGFDSETLNDIYDNIGDTEDLFEDEEEREHGSIFNDWGSGTYPGGPGMSDNWPGHDAVTATVVIDDFFLTREIYENGMSVSDGVITLIRNEVGEHPDLTFGELKDQELFYMAVDSGNKTYISVCSSTHMKERVSSTIIHAIGIYIIAMLFFFFITLFLSWVAVRPVARSWKQQTQFIADASHEMKTPLTVILANGNILLDQQPPLPEESAKWVVSTQEEATHMKNLLDKLLFLARKDSGSQKMMMQRLSLSDAAYGGILAFEPVAFENGVTIGSDISPDVDIIGDATMINQLIHILLDNACKYSGANGAVTVTLKKDRQGCLLTVHNTGRPIPAEDLPHVFERFYQADKSRSFNGESHGYGLGLAIAKSIADEHKAVISVTSSEAFGTAFRVRFKHTV